MTGVGSKGPGTLLIAPSVGFAQDQDGLWFDKKFVEGMGLYTRLWGGRTRCLMRRTEKARLPFGDYFELGRLPFELAVLEDEEVGARHVEGADVVLAVGDSHDHLALAEIAAAKRPALCYIVEHNQRIRYRIIEIENAGLARKAKSFAWTWLTERRRVAAFKKADALQANGTPAFDRYSALQPNALLYFDTRMKEDLFGTRGEIDVKAARLRKGASLRLIFSGRLERIKGADHLPLVARALRERKVDFTLEIFGAGSFHEQIDASIEAFGLGGHVRLKGVLDFETELAPYVRAYADIFVCCHRQADPSCTYLETYGCGVPMVSYDNEAFRGVRRLSGAGWSVPMDRPDLMAARIDALNRDREQIVSNMVAALAFARDHSFEKTFARRIAQLQALAKQ